MATGSPVPQQQRRSAGRLAGLNSSPAIGRFAVTSHFNRKVAELAPASRFPKLKAFAPQNVLPWIGNYLKYALTPRYPFQSYATGPGNGVYRVAPRPGSDAVRIAIAGDWGTGTSEAQAVASLMVSTEPDLTIHLGDVYYVGDDAEIAENCLGRATDQFQGVSWPHGLQGSFALNGNHEMYANGKPYFTTFLKTLGMPSGSGQRASFFCLEAGQWRILGIDTGYNSVGIPILSQIPGINSIGPVGGDCHLESALMKWLRDTVRPKEDPKPTLLLSHHQYFTAFNDHAYTKPARQLIEFFHDQEVVWIWGHEHRLAFYSKFGKDGGITAHGRCVGHSGMPVELGDPDPSKAPITFYDPRSHVLEDGSKAGQNGFVLATLRQSTLTLDYRDIDNNQLLTETFEPAASGTLRHSVANPAGILKPPPARH
jgi:hypothetical protein